MLNRQPQAANPSRLVSFVGVLLLFFCGQLVAADQELRVFIPCGTTGPILAGARRFQAGHPGVAIVPIVEKARILQKKVASGAPGDVLIALGPEEAKMVRPLCADSPATDIGAMALALVAPAGNPGKLSRIEDLASPLVKRVLVGGKASLPGRYTHQALRKFGLDQRLVGKLVAVKPPDALALQTALARGEAAILFKSCIQRGLDARGRPQIAKTVRLIGELPENSHERIGLQALVLRNSKRPQLARQFIAFLLEPAQQKEFLAAGFRTSMKR